MEQLTSMADRLRQRPLQLIGAVLLILAALVLLAQRQAQTSDLTDAQPATLLSGDELLVTAPAEPTASPPAEATLPPQLIAVYISGAVMLPGVYRLALDARVDDALRAAGGPSEDAALGRINLAARLQDAQHVHVPRVGEELPAAEQPQQPAAGHGSVSLAPGQVNINTAGIAELDALPRIGPATAQRIIDYRTTNGPFTRPEDLMQVKGIGPSVYEAIAAMVTVEP